MGTIACTLDILFWLDQERDARNGLGGCFGLNAPHLLAGKTHAEHSRNLAYADVH